MARSSHRNAKPKHYKRTRPRPRQSRDILTRNQSVSSGTFFQKLPPEVFEMILGKLSAQEISVFSMVSKDITTYVMDFMSTVAWKNKMIMQNFHYSTRVERSSIIGHYRDLGLLFKRCTLLLPTKERLKFTFNRLSQMHCFMLEQCLAQVCIGFSCFGVFLQTLVAGWDVLECQTVFSFLCEHTNLHKKMETVISGTPGVSGYQELQLRLFCRQVLLDPWPNQTECQFWLVQLLKPWPLVSQAHLLFIFYGPLLPEGTLGWQALVERGMPSGHLCDLAKAFMLLFGNLEVEGQTPSSMLAIFEELIGIPQQWHMENVARLLVLCGGNVCYMVLANKAVNGQLIGLSRVLVHIILVCEKDGFQMSWMVKLVKKICNMYSTASEKLCFLQHLEEMFSDVTRELIEVILLGIHPMDMDFLQSLSILFDSRDHFHAEFLHMLLK